MCCLLLHGVEEKPDEDIEEIVMDVLNTKLDAGLSQRDVGRTHRVGRSRKGGKKPRPIIVRFLSYRQRKSVFDVKRKLKGLKIVITESLTKTRYALLQRCINIFGKYEVWSYDGRIYCKTRDGKKVFTTDDELSFFLVEDVPVDVPGDELVVVAEIVPVEEECLPKSS